MADLFNFTTTRGNTPYGERMGIRESPDEATRQLVCNWTNYEELIANMMYDVSVEDKADTFGNIRKVLRRKLPEPHPRKPWMYCVDWELANSYGVPVRGPGGKMAFATNTQNQDGMAEILMHYKPLPYMVNVTDEQVDTIDPDFSGQGELNRFVIRTAPSIQAEACQIGGAAFKFVPSQAPIGQESPVKTLSLVEMNYTWVGIPVDYIPAAALGMKGGSVDKPSLGRINNAPFDPRLNLLRLTNGIPLCSLLFHGTEIRYDEFRYTPTGVRVLDLKYIASYRPMGWNFLFRRSQRAFQEVTFDGNPLQQNEPGGVADGARPYDSMSFLELFTLTAPPA